MLILSIVIGLAIFCIMLAVYNYYQKDDINVSKRLGSIGAIKTNNKRTRGDFWQDLKGSKIKEIASVIASKFGNILPKQDYFARMSEKAGLPISGAELLILIVGSSAVWFILLSLLMFNMLKGFLLALLWFAMCFVYVQSMGTTRMKEFDDQLGDAIVMMNNALRAGFTFQQAMDTVSKELPDPMAGEFTRALREVQLGVPLEDALNGISKRMQSDDFDLLATAVIIQRQIGGNLTQILDTIGTTIRDRVKLKQEIKVLTAEGVFAGWTVALLPFIVAFMVVSLNPNYFDEFLKQSYTKYVIIGCLISELIGGLIIKKIISIKV